MLRLISYSSVDSFIKRDSVLDILDKYKVNPKILEHLQKQTRDADLNIFDLKLETKRNLMSKEKGIFVQHRREYYNDFEDCLRDYKNAKIKSLQKQTKIHLSDGDNGDSDSEYVDCTDTNELRHQTSSKSMPHVSSGIYRDGFSQQLEKKATATCIETEAQSQITVKAQLKADYNDLRTKNESSTQFTTHNNNNNNQIRNSSCNNSVISASDRKVNLSEKSITIHGNITAPSTSNIKFNVNQHATDNQQTESKDNFMSTTVQNAHKKDEQTRRKSCKKKKENVLLVMKDPTQR
ncbi:CLUMA_CG004390, isoform A [Clunio marinus]|uniref:CLUMA_CG004390, isoform A n=1 Tax=Clunio marinus TaxID=568069 RepID=A0A1J1HRP3_9DIPT|nr:CLUMA_CG004390, isoform A [Clunio marinus]